MGAIETVSKRDDKSKVKGGAAGVQTFTPEIPVEGEFKIVEVASIAPEGLNPRHTFNEEKLAELTASVRDKGVLEPLLVRPTKKPKGKVRYELVAGERRLKAALRANLKTVPVIVSDFSDQQALEVAVIENEQREEVPLLEKADGYVRLMKEYGYSAEQLAQRIGKSEAHVHATVKLLNVPDFAKTFVDDGTLSKSHAEIIARVPSEDGRAKLAREIIFGDGGNTPAPVSVRTAKRYADKYTAELSKAEFDTADETLVEGVPACTGCHFKAGNNRLDYPEGRADICNNVPCFTLKTEAGRERKLSLLKERQGATVMSAEDVKKYLPYGYLLGTTPYVELKNKCTEDDQRRTYKQLVGNEVGKSVKLFVAVDRRDGSINELALRSEVNEVLKREHRIDLNARRKPSRDEVERKIRSQARGVVVLNVLGLVAAYYEKQAARALAPKFEKHLRAATVLMLKAVQNDPLRDVAKSRGLEIKGQYPQFGKELSKVAEKLKGPALFGLMMAAGVCESLHFWKAAYGGEMDARAREVIKAAGIDLAKLEAAEVSAIKEKRAQREGKAKKASKGGQKAAGKKSGKGAKAARTSAAGR